MKIIEASASIRNPFKNYMTNEQLGACLLENVEFFARLSHRSEEEELTGSKFMTQVVMDRMDWSVVEHSMISVDAVMDRGITHEWVRHRVGVGYTQESTRFVSYVKKMPPSFVYPQVEGDKAVKCPHCLAGDQPVRLGEFAYKVFWAHRLNSKDMPAEILCLYDSDWLDAIDCSERKYKALLDKGWRPQEARSVFPTGLAARIGTTANLRAWRHFFLSRTTKQAHPQIRLIASDLLRQFQVIIPVLYDDIVPGNTQKHNFSLGR
jgi:thymidylate synthase (FAD)